MLNGCAVSGSVARITEATTVSALETSRMPNLAASFAATSSTRPQASHSGASRSANSWTARNVTGPKPLANPMLCAASAMVSPRVAAVHTTNTILRLADAPASEHAGRHGRDQHAREADQDGKRH